MGITSNNKYVIFEKVRCGDERVKGACTRCKKEFKDGELIFKKRTKTIKPYHAKCWEKLLIN